MAIVQLRLSFHWSPGRYGFVQRDAMLAAIRVTRQFPLTPLYLVASFAFSWLFHLRIVFVSKRIEVKHLFTKSFQPFILASVFGFKPVCAAYRRPALLFVDWITGLCEKLAMNRTFLAIVLLATVTLSAFGQTFTPPVQTNNISYTNLAVIMPSSTDQKARLDFLSAISDSTTTVGRSLSIYDGGFATAIVSANVLPIYTNATAPLTGAVFTNFFPFATSASSNSIAVSDHLAIYLQSSNSFPNKGWFYRVAVTPLTTNVTFSGGNLFVKSGDKLYAWRNTTTIVPPLVLTSATEKTITAPTGWFAGTAGNPLLIQMGVTNTGAFQLLISGRYESAFPQ